MKFRKPEHIQPLINSFYCLFINQGINSGKGGSFLSAVQWSWTPVFPPEGMNYVNLSDNCVTIQNCYQLNFTG
jgi:hypothetical protein